MNFINIGTDESTTAYLKKSLNTDKDYGEITIKIKGQQGTLNKLEQMLAYMEHLGCIGHSTSFKVLVDGDGAFRIKTKDNNGEQLSKKHMDTITNPEGKDIESFDFS